MKTIMLLVALAVSATASAETLQGRWKLVDAVDLRPDGSIARYPWGRHPVGSIVVQGGSCILQIMATEVPDFTATDTTVTEQMKASLLSTYIAYTAPARLMMPRA